MDHNEIIREFEEAGAILKGHFVLSSGLHSDTYLQCALALMDTVRAEKLCSALAEKIRGQLEGKSFDIVISPAMGGVVVGYETGRQLALPAIFCERQDGRFTFRRGFHIEKGAKVLVVEDVVTTGKSSREAMAAITEAGGEIIAEACLVNRSGTVKPFDDINIPLISLLEMEVQTWPADNLPPELAAIPTTKPGSRWLK